MSSMYEAMKKAAEINPEFAETLDEAVKANKERIKKEAAEQRARATAAYQAKVAREQREAQEKEHQRRATEYAILSNPNYYPFAYCYPFMGAYSASFGIVFADTADTAREMVIKKINSEFDMMNPTYSREEDRQLALKRLHVYQLDLSEGIVGVGEYYE